MKECNGIREWNAMQVQSIKEWMQKEVMKECNAVRYLVENNECKSKCRLQSAEEEGRGDGVFLQLKKKKMMMMIEWDPSLLHFER